MARKGRPRASRERASRRGPTPGAQLALREQLRALGLVMKPVQGDGNCLFRALADQLDGDERHHATHRAQICAYMRQHEADFAPFVEDDVDFATHMRALEEDGTFGGNDALVAFARLHDVDVIVHQSMLPPWILSPQPTAAESQQPPRRRVHLVYHSHEHYDSVARLPGASNRAVVVAAPSAEVAPSTTSTADEPADGESDGDAADEEPPATPAAERAPPKRISKRERKELRRRQKAQKRSAAAAAAAAGGDDDDKGDASTVVRQLEALRV